MLETTDALQPGPGRKVAREEQSLRSPTDMQDPLQIPKLEVGAEDNPCDLEGEVMAVADLLVKEEAHVKTEWLARVAQVSVSFDGRNAGRISAAVSRVSRMGRAGARLGPSCSELDLPIHDEPGQVLKARPLRTHLKTVKD